MTNGGWTPGPWEVRDLLGDLTIHTPDTVSHGYRLEMRIASDIGGHNIKQADGTWDRSQRLGNAHLLASAPELYEALDEALDWMETVQAAMHRMEGGDNFDGAPLAKAKAALAKARGDSGRGG